MKADLKGARDYVVLRVIKPVVPVNDKGEKLTLPDGVEPEGKFVQFIVHSMGPMLKPMEVGLEVGDSILLLPECPRMASKRCEELIVVHPAHILAVVTEIESEVN